jgi:CheY-like chemotaxis protein
VARLAEWGYTATAYNRAGPALLRAIRETTPSAVLIDLSRLPVQGRDVAVELRQNSATRPIPIVFVDGLPEKVLLVRQVLPDAAYSTWTHLRDDLTTLFNRPPRAYLVPATAPAAAKSGPSVADKLGLQPNTIVALLNAPPDFAAELEPLPAGVRLQRQMDPASALTVWFIRSRRELQDGLTLRADRLGASRLWIVWSKKTSGQSGELSPAAVRDLCLAAGLTELKTAASLTPALTGVLFARG